VSLVNVQVLGGIGQDAGNQLLPRFSTGGSIHAVERVAYVWQGWRGR
jgi:hypothetical protein